MAAIWIGFPSSDCQSWRISTSDSTRCRWRSLLDGRRAAGEASSRPLSIAQLNILESSALTRFAIMGLPRSVTLITSSAKCRRVTLSIASLPTTGSISRSKIFTSSRYDLGALLTREWRSKNCLPRPDTVVASSAFALARDFGRCE